MIIRWLQPSEFFFASSRRRVRPQTRPAALVDVWKFDSREAAKGLGAGPLNWIVPASLLTGLIAKFIY